MLSMEPVPRSERDQLLRMAEDYWLGFQSQPHPADPVSRAKRFDEEFWNQAEGRCLWWAKLDGAAIGFAKTELFEDYVWGTHGDISEFYIAPAFRDQGHGKEFVVLILDWFARRGISSVRLFVRWDNPAAMAFWEKLGFVAVQRWTQMRKDLAR